MHMRKRDREIQTERKARITHLHRSILDRKRKTEITRNIAPKRLKKIFKKLKETRIIMIMIRVRPLK